MNINNIDKHGYLKLIELTLDNDTFSISQACEKTGLNFKQFNFAKHQIFILNAAQEKNQNDKEIQQWELAPESFFNYLQYLEFKHSVDSSRKSTVIAIIAIIIIVFFGVNQRH